MECIVWSAPILPGKLEAWKAFAEDTRKGEEYDRQRKRMGVVREVVSLMQTPGRGLRLHLSRGQGSRQGLPGARPVGRSLRRVVSGPNYGAPWADTGNVAGTPAGDRHRRLSQRRGLSHRIERRRLGYFYAEHLVAVGEHRDLA